MDALLVIFSYLLGSIPVGLFLAKAFTGKDPRQVGSRNIGATNIYRTAGKKLALATLAGDALKGFIPVLLAISLQSSPLWIGISGLSAFLGHLYPVFLKFKGGKGVATALGIYLALCPMAVLIVFFVFAGILVGWRIVSVSSMSAALLMPFLVWILTGSQAYLFTSICIGGLIVYRHRTNIRRLLAGQENRIELRLRSGP